MERDQGLLQAGEMTKGSDVEVVLTKPWIAQNERLTWRVQDVKLSQLIVVPGQKHGYLGGLVCDSSQDMAI